MASRSSATRRSYSSLVICGSHWNAVWGLGTNQLVETVMRTPRLLVLGALPPRVHDAGGQVRDAQHVLVRLGGQTQHEIELHGAAAAGKGRAAGLQQILLA